MRILRHVRDAPRWARGAAVAIGNFDGVHRGHAAVIEAAGEHARALGAPWAVMTFEPHPRAFFTPDIAPFRLTPFRAKARRLAALGVEVMITLRFDAGLAATSAEDFVSDLLVAGLGVGHVVVGPDFSFGKGRRGDAHLLRRMAAAHGFGFTEIAPVGEGSGRYASTEIRALARRGAVDEVARALGEPWSIEGRVLGGEGRGRGLGFPTANLSLAGLLHPGPGIYAVRALIDGDDRWHDGAAYVGARPTFDGHEVLLETTLFDYDGDLYGRRLRVAFVERIRADRAFDDAASLSAQMAEDCRRARRILAAAATRSSSAA